MYLAPHDYVAVQSGRTSEVRKCRERTPHAKTTRTTKTWWRTTAAPSGLEGRKKKRKTWKTKANGADSRRHCLW